MSPAALRLSRTQQEGGLSRTQQEGRAQGLAFSLILRVEIPQRTSALARKPLRVSNAHPSLFKRSLPTADALVTVIRPNVANSTLFPHLNFLDSLLSHKQVMDEGVPNE
jgi:hypothetical protein